MRLFKTSLLAATLVLAIPMVSALAQDADGLSRSDGISLSGGDANRANIAIQTPTPWPRYLNDFDYDMPGERGVGLMTSYLKTYSPGAPGSTLTKSVTMTGDTAVSTTQVK